MQTSLALPSRARRLMYGALTLAIAISAATLFASDHQDTPEVELSPRMDINDIYAFPGASADRIVLVMTTSSPITPAQSATASFDPNLLYQLKIDNTGDGVEDRVIQFTFSGNGASQQVQVRGPAVPLTTGMINSVVNAAPSLTGTLNTTLGAPTGMQVFVGLRDDPFFLDLEQFFRIVPDRAPVQGPLSKIGPQQEATSFRNPGIDFLRGINTLAIVVELPTQMLLGSNAGATDPALGIWATTSR